MNTITNIRNRALSTAKQFYLAGLGVAVTVSDRTVKTFDELVEKGETVNKKEATKDQESESHGITTRVKEFTDKAGNRIQEGITSSLGRLGIPSRDEIQAITHSVEQLTDKIKNMQLEKTA